MVYIKSGVSPALSVTLFKYSFDLFTLKSEIPLRAEPAMAESVMLTVELSESIKDRTRLPGLPEKVTFLRVRSVLSRINPEADIKSVPD